MTCIIELPFVVFKIYNCSIRIDSPVRVAVHLGKYFLGYALLVFITYDFIIVYITHKLNKAYISLIALATSLVALASFPILAKINISV